MSITAGQSSIIEKLVLAESMVAGEVVRFRKDSTVEKVFCGNFKLKKSAITNVNLVELGVDKFMVAFADSAKAGTATVASITEKAVTFGSDFVFDTSVSKIKSARLAPDKAVLAYQSLSSGAPEAVVATVANDNTVVFGTPVSLGTNLVEVMSVTAVDTNKAIIAMVDRTVATGAIDHIAKVAIADVSGSVITMAASTDFSTATVNAVDMVTTSVDSVNNVFKALVCCSIPSINEGQGIVLDIVGSAITTQPAVSFHNEGFALGHIASTKISANKVLTAFSGDAVAQSRLVVADVSGAALTYGARAKVVSQNVEKVLVANIDTNKAVLFDSAGSQVVEVSPDNSIVLARRARIEASASVIQPLAVKRVAVDKVILATDAATSTDANIGITEALIVKFDTRVEWVGILLADGVAGDTRDVLLSGVYKPPTALQRGRYQIARGGGIEIAVNSEESIIIGKTFNGGDSLLLTH